MNTLTRNLSIWLLFLIISVHFEHTFGQFFRESVRTSNFNTTHTTAILIPCYFQKNRIHYEKLICKVYPGGKVAAHKCLTKYIDRNNVKVDSHVNFIEPLNNLWAGIRLDGKSKSFVLDWILPIIGKYTNVNHPCPYNSVYIKPDNISVNGFAFPQIIPSGRYRINIKLAQGDERTVFKEGDLYFSISDHRIEVV